MIERGIRCIESITRRSTAGYRCPSGSFTQRTFELLHRYGFALRLEHDGRRLHALLLPRRRSVAGRRSVRVRPRASIWSRSRSPGTSTTSRSSSTPRAGAASARGSRIQSACSRCGGVNSSSCAASSERGVYTLTMHPQVIGRGHRMLMLEELLDRIAAIHGVEFTTIGEVAADWRERNPLLDDCAHGRSEQRSDGAMPDETSRSPGHRRVPRHRPRVRSRPRATRAPRRGALPPRAREGARLRGVAPRRTASGGPGRSADRPRRRERWSRKRCASAAASTSWSTTPASTSCTRRRCLMGRLAGGVEPDPRRQPARPGARHLLGGAPHDRARRRPHHRRLVARRVSWRARRAGVCREQSRAQRDDAVARARARAEERAALRGGAGVGRDRDGDGAPRGSRGRRHPRAEPARPGGATAGSRRGGRVPRLRRRRVHLDRLDRRPLRRVVLRS